MSAKLPNTDTLFNIIDLSNVEASDTAPVYDGPTFFIPIISPKGPEELKKVPVSKKGKTFFNLYCKKENISFNKYGQSLLTAAILAEDEAELIIKRIVAEDATLANSVVYGQIIVSEIQETDEDGYLLYITPDGIKTVVAEGNEPLMVKQCKLRITVKSFPNIKTIKALTNIVKSTLDEDNMIYPLFIITDNGRGVSNKKFRISADLTSSKRLDYMKYNLEVFEADKSSNERIELLTFASNPNKVENKSNLSIKTVITTYSDQIKCELFESYQDLMVEKLSELTGYDESYFKNNDLYNCKDKQGNNMPCLTLDTSEGYANLAYITGLSLDNGTNGNFGSIPINSEYFEQELLKLFADESSDRRIYDIDHFKIDIIPDCNFPIAVKSRITEYAEYTKCFFLRDMGTDLETYSDIIEMGKEFLDHDSNNPNSSRTSATYPLYYDIIDPYSLKQITVTSTLELAELAINHFSNGKSCPFAGEKFNMVFKRYIPGTESFIPLDTPTMKQTEEFAEYRLNYAITNSDDKLVQMLQVTSQDIVSEASHIGNMFGILNIIKEIRKIAPSIKYAFIDTEEDLKNYTDIIEQRVLDKHRSEFSELSLVYLDDPTEKQNKTFRAAINVKCKQFSQREIFDIYINKPNM